MMQKRWRYASMLMMLVLIVGCARYHAYERGNPGRPAVGLMYSDLNEGMQQDRAITSHATQELPKSVANALLPEVDTPSHPVSTATRFNLTVKEMPANTFFMSLVKGTSYNMILNPNVVGNISLDLKQVTIPEVLEIVHTMYGFNYKEMPYGYEVSVGGLETRVFTVNYLDIERQGESNTLVSSGQVSEQLASLPNATNSTTPSSSSVLSQLAPTSSVATKSKSEFWEKLRLTVEALVGQGRGQRVVVNANAGIVVVRANAEALQQVEDYLSSLQKVMTRQVMLDAKILEVQLFDGYKAGIDWKALGLEQIGYKDIDADIKEFTDVFTVRTGYDRFIHLLSTQGNVQVLSSPRITTLNNQAAVIKVGQDEFFVTDVNSTTTSTSGTSDVSQDVQLTPFFSGISLDVLPQIDARGGVSLHIHPVVSRVTADSKQFTVSGKNQDLPLAKSTIRESDNIVHAENGEMIVIGGLMEDKMEEHTAGTPVLGKLPMVGTMFRSTNQMSTKTELVILLRPIVTQARTWEGQLRQAKRRLQHVDRGYHFGDHPDVFGNLGEEETGN